MSNVFMDAEEAYEEMQKYINLIIGRIDRIEDIIEKLEERLDEATTSASDDSKPKSTGHICTCCN